MITTRECLPENALATTNRIPHLYGHAPKSQTQLAATISYCVAEGKPIKVKYVKTLGRNGKGKGGKVYRKELEQIDRLDQKGYTIPDIARQRHRNPMTIRKKIHSLRGK